MFTLDHILEDIKVHIEKQLPFSIVRLGDGDLKILQELRTGIFNSVRSNRESYNAKNSQELLNSYINACNNANYTSSFDLYLNGQFWRSCQAQRLISKDCVDLMIGWKNFYAQLGITNMNYCSPELGWQLFLQRKRKINLLNIIEKQQVVVITCWPTKVSRKLQASQIDAIPIAIPGRFGNHYSKVKITKDRIKEMIKSRQIFLLGAGAWGRGYSDYIKSLGGIAIDIGKVCDLWAGFTWNRAYLSYVNVDVTKTKFSLTDQGRKYISFF
jgi:hypothetical protein